MKLKNVNDLTNYCCLALVHAVERGYLDEVVSGIYFSNLDDSTCKSGVPRVDYCPFCRAKIVSIKYDMGWDWKTEKLDIKEVV